MLALVQTHRLSLYGEVEEELYLANVHGDVISDQTARTLAAWHATESPRDIPLCQLARGKEFDTDELRACVDRNMDIDEQNAMHIWLDALEALLRSES